MDLARNKAASMGGDTIVIEGRPKAARKPSGCTNAARLAIGSDTLSRPCH